MPQNKSYGFYSFPVSVLKYTNEILSEVLSNIFNKSNELGTFPSKLKMAKVIPIFKSDDETDPNNYRPISLLSCFNRIFEKLVFKRLKSFIDERKLYVPHNMASDKVTQRNMQFLILLMPSNQIWMQVSSLVVSLLT